MLKPRHESERATTWFKIKAFFMMLLIAVPTLAIGLAVARSTDSLLLIAVVTFGTFVAIANLLGE